MNDPPELRALSLVLTSRCNLGCSYCFQSAKTGRRMEWRTLRDALDLALRSPSAGQLVFLGGEPTLEMPAIRRAVEYVESRRPESRRFRYKIVTNGTLLGAPDLDFLDEHGIETHLSLDGVPGAQSLRGVDTFARTDNLLHQFSRHHPDFFHRSVEVTLTLSPGSVPLLAESIGYFLENDVASFSVSPVFTDSSDWRCDRVGELEEQFCRISNRLLGHFHRTGQIPFAQFRPSPVHSPNRRIERLSMCGAGRGEHLTVDVDGTLYGCVTFVGSYQSWPETGLGARMSSFRIGRIGDPDLPTRIARYRAASRETGILDEKQEKASSYGRCGECVHIEQCGICPMAIVHLRGNENPRRIPDFPCDFNRVALESRERFLRATARLRMGEGPPAVMLPEPDRGLAPHFSRIRDFVRQL